MPWAKKKLPQLLDINEKVQKPSVSLSEEQLHELAQGLFGIEEP